MVASKPARNLVVHVSQHVQMNAHSGPLHSEHAW